MTLGLVLLLSFFSLGTAMVGISAFIVREKVTTMHGMVFAMAMAMSMGLFVGTLSGILFQGHLISSTVIGIGGGIMVGGIIGSYFSFLALLEGLLSGVMAGMMGAMLGDMVKPGDWDILLMVIFTISLSICFMIMHEIMTYVQKRYAWVQIYQSPLIMASIFVLLCFVLFLQAPFILVPH